MMRKIKIAVVIFVYSCLLLTSCNDKRFIQRVQEYEEGVSNPTSEAELKDAIKKYLRRIDDIVIAYERVGIWYKMLATRYLDKKMYKNALETLEKAVEIYPENQNLYYKIGVCAANIAKGSLDFEVRGQDVSMRYFDLAARSYKRAIELDPNYSKAIYALSVLYVFELARPEEAITLLEGEIEGKMKPLDELFLLAQAYVAANHNDKAIEAYKRIIELSGSATQKKQAQENIDILLMRQKK